ncbi:hypothetical protein ACFSKM_16380 [Ancylobacter dichloromethanicus]
METAIFMTSWLQLVRTRGPTTSQLSAIGKRFSRIVLQTRLSSGNSMRLQSSRSAEILAGISVSMGGTPPRWSAAAFARCRVASTCSAGCAIPAFFNADRFKSAGFRQFFATLEEDLDDTYLEAARADLNNLTFRHGLLLSAQVGDGGKAFGTMLRKPQPRDLELDTLYSHARRAELYISASPPR